MVSTLKAQWPTGNRGIPYVKTGGCPIARGFSFASGSRTHSANLANAVSHSQHFPPLIKTEMALINDEYTGALYFLPIAYVTQHVCIKTSTSAGTGDWPKGKYCLFVYGNECPTGFT